MYSLESYFFSKRTIHRVRLQKSFLGFYKCSSPDLLDPFGLRRSAILQSWFQLLSHIVRETLVVPREKNKTANVNDTTSHSSLHSVVSPYSFSSKKIIRIRQDFFPMTSRTTLMVKFNNSRCEAG